MLVFFCSFIFFLGFKDVQAAGENSHAHEFNVLCKLFRIADNEIPEPDARALNAAKRLNKEMDDMYVLISANESYYKEVLSKVSTEVAGKVRRLPNSSLRHSVARQLERIHGRAEAIYQKISSTYEEMKSSSSNTRKSLQEAIYGAGATTKDDKLTDKKITFGADVSEDATGTKQCGGNGSNGSTNGGNVGVSLINDFLCLCVGTSASTNQDKPCAQTVTPSGRASWDATFLSQAGTSWGAVKKACPHTGLNATPEAIDAALGTFFAVLGSQAKDHASEGRFILGKSTSGGNNECDGGVTDYRVCVNYKYQLSDASRGIPWAKKFREAQTELLAVRRDERHADRLLQQLEQYNDSAWDLYEHTWDQIEFTKESDKAGTPGGTDFPSAPPSGRQSEKPLSNEGMANSVKYRRLTYSMASVTRIISVILS